MTLRARYLTFLLVIFAANNAPTTAAAAEDPKADDLAAAVARMAKIGSAFSPSFSPDGKTLAFVTDLTGVPQVWTVPTQGGWPQRVTALDDQIDSVTWAPQGDWLAFSLAPGGGMNQQVLPHPPRGHGARLPCGDVDEVEVAVAAALHAVEHGARAVVADVAELADAGVLGDAAQPVAPALPDEGVHGARVVLHEANDTNVPVVEAEQVVDNLKKRGIPVEYVLFPDEGHGWDKEANKVRSTVAIVEWFERYLKG